IILLGCMSRQSCTSPSIISFFFLLLPPPPRSTLFPYTTLFRSSVVQIYDYGVHAGFEYLAMEYLPRGDLKARMQQGVSEHDALRSEEHTSELQSPYELVCRLLLEKKKNRARLTCTPITSSSSTA